MAIRDGLIAAVGPTPDVMREWGDPRVPSLDATGMTVLPGLIECHSHPLFAGERHLEYAKRLAGASLAEIAAAGGGIWASVLATRAASSEHLLDGLRGAYGRILAGGVTTLEVKSGYGLTLSEELRQLELLDRSRGLTPMQLVITFLGAHVVPAGMDADAYVSEVLAMLDAVVGGRLCTFHDITCERGLFTPAQARVLFDRSRALGVPTRCHADAWAGSEGWQTAVAGGAISAEHLTYTPDDEIRAVGATDTIAVLLPQAELIYMTDRRASARTVHRCWRAGRGRHRLLLLDPRHLAAGDARDGRAVVSHDAGRGDRGRDAERGLRAGPGGRSRISGPRQAGRSHAPVGEPSW